MELSPHFQAVRSQTTRRTLPHVVHTVFCGCTFCFCVIAYNIGRYTHTHTHTHTSPHVRLMSLRHRNLTLRITWLGNGQKQDVSNSVMVLQHFAVKIGTTVGCPLSINFVWFLLACSSEHLGAPDQLFRLVKCFCRLSRTIWISAL